MTAAELARFVGKTGTLAIETGQHRDQLLAVAVRIVDARSVFARVDLLVEPVAGAGRGWVSADRVTIEGEA